MASANIVYISSEFIFLALMHHNKFYYTTMSGAEVPKYQNLKPPCRSILT